MATHVALADVSADHPWKTLCSCGAWSYDHMAHVSRAETGFCPTCNTCTNCGNTSNYCHVIDDVDHGRCCPTCSHCLPLVMPLLGLEDQA